MVDVLATTFMAPTDDGLKLAVSSVGTGPPLLLIPGLGASRAIYAPIIDGLAASFRVLVFDPRGIGESEIPDADFGVAELSADAVAVLRAAGVERAHVMGASLGGVVAQHVALDHPGSVDRLILAATHPGRAHGVRATAEVNDALLGRGARSPAGAYRKACTVLYAPWFQASQPQFIEAEIKRRAALPVSARVFACQLAVSRHDETYRRLSGITVPTLVLHGTDDVITPLGNAEILMARIPGAEAHWFTGGGHLFFHESPAATVATVSEFLRL